MGTPWWIWIVAVGLLATCVLRVMIRGRIARSQSGLDSEEIAVVRRAGRVDSGEVMGRVLGYSVLDALGLQLLLNVILFRQASRYRKHRAAAKKLVPTNPREQNRAQGVIFAFHELRLTRTELIKGYEANAQRTPLQGLTATVLTGQTVQIRIEGPDTKFVYRGAFDAEFDFRHANQFAGLLNYEASSLVPRRRKRTRSPRW